MDCCVSGTPERNVAYKGFRDVTYATIDVFLAVDYA